MEQHPQAATLETSYSSLQEAVVGDDPPLQSFDDQNKNSLYHSRRSSIKCCSYMQRFSGIMYSLISSLLFTSSFFIIKQLDVSLLDVFLIRSIIQGFISFGFIIYKGYYPFYSKCHGLLIFIQSLIAAIGTVCFFHSLIFLPLPDLTTIRYTQIVWTALLAFIIFRERITLPIIIACLLTLIGVSCVAQPTFLFTKSKNINETLQTTVSTDNEKRSLGMFIALLCALSISISIILNKKLIEKKVRQSIIMFYCILATFVLLLINQTYYWAFLKTNHQKFDIKKIYLTKNFMYATIFATLQLIPMVLLQKSIKREHPSIISVVQASEIIFAIILQNIFSTNKSNSLALVGSALVVTSIVIVGVHKFWQDRHKRTCIPISIQENK